MDHEIARELYRAGFPSHQLCNNECMTSGDVGIDMCVPTLSELIEACGEEFHELVREDDGRFGCRRDYMDMDYLTYPTPEESLARLYLATKGVLPPPPSHRA